MLVSDYGFVAQFRLSIHFLVNGRWVTNVGKIRLSEPWGFSGA